MMLDTDLAVLKSQSATTLAQWWTELNLWGWPESLPNPEPAEYRKGGRRGQIMGWISEKIGMKQCLQYWNRKLLPGAQFDNWWENNMGAQSAMTSPFTDEELARLAKNPQHDISDLARELLETRKDARRMDWLSQYANRHWDGTIGRAPYWRFQGWPFNALQGETLSEAIDAALAEGK